jgi:hypothetical protein
MGQIRGYIFIDLNELLDKWFHIRGINGDIVQLSTLYHSTGAKQIEGK